MRCGGCWLPITPSLPKEFHAYCQELPTIELKKKYREASLFMLQDANGALHLFVDAYVEKNGWDCVYDGDMSRDIEILNILGAEISLRRGE